MAGVLRQLCRQQHRCAMQERRREGLKMVAGEWVGKTEEKDGGRRRRSSRRHRWAALRCQQAVVQRKKHRGCGDRVVLLRGSQDLGSALFKHWIEVVAREVAPDLGAPRVLSQASAQSE